MSLAPGVMAADAPSWWSRGDVVAAVLLIALPAVIFGVPALFGHAVLPGDDLTQNFPLRVLAGREIRAGHLPLFDPYIWSGAPLLAGWNAAAAYPLTWLFAILPGTAAWTLNMIVTWAVAGLGMFCFLRALRLACAWERFSCCPGWPRSAVPSAGLIRWPCTVPARCRSAGCC